jgi:hypothetical protein
MQMEDTWFFVFPPEDSALRTAVKNGKTKSVMSCKWKTRGHFFPQRILQYVPPLQIAN